MRQKIVTTEKKISTSRLMTFFSLAALGMDSPMGHLDCLINCHFHHGIFI